jgi:hypothetical protein
VANSRFPTPLKTIANTAQIEIIIRIKYLVFIALTVFKIALN